MDWIEPWQSVTTPAEASALLAELRKELAPGHPLHGLPLVAVGRRSDCDDVLFAVIDESGRFASVHLTRRGGPETLPWPSTNLYQDRATWAAAEMQSQDGIDEVY